jgi:hypothetical protein
MAIDQEKWTRLIAKLIADTQNRKIVWRELAVPEPTTGNLLAFALNQTSTYLAEFYGQAFRFDVQKPGSLARDPAQAFKLSIATKDGTVLRIVPVTSGLSDLRQTVEDQVSKVDEFVARYLANG